MVGKNQIKRITSLHHKKFRKSSGYFIAEGRKVISELLEAGFVLDALYVTSDLFNEVSPALRQAVSEDIMARMTALTNPSDCLAVFEMKQVATLELSGLILALDDVRDPGNLGTIIRLCDWFGVKHLVCSPESADVYNPKVVQATMGSLARVNVHYLPLQEVLTTRSVPVFGTFMDGGNVYHTALPKEGILVLGNEANGISDAIASCCQNRLAIPRFGTEQKTESLNVATAAAIFLSEFRRSF